MTQDTVEYLRGLWATIDKEDGPYEGELPEAIGVYGRCHDCGCDVTLSFNRGCEVVGGEGGIWHFPHLSTPFVKCGGCLEKDAVLRNYQPCEVFSRVVGYYRPVQMWNRGKVAEFRERVNYDMGKACGEEEAEEEG